MKATEKETASLHENDLRAALIRIANITSFGPNEPKLSAEDIRKIHAIAVEALK